MAHLNSITATQYTKFAISRKPIPDGFCDTEKEYYDLFRGEMLDHASVTGLKEQSIVYLESMRDIPQTGTPANIVKVPVYGEDQSFSIGAQPDSPDLEFTLNLEPEAWAVQSAPTTAATTAAAAARRAYHKSQIKRMAGSGTEYAMAFYYLNAKLERPVTRPGVASADKKFYLPSAALAATDLARIEYDAVGQNSNSLMFFRGRVESVLYNPMRDDASTATVTLSITSPDFYGLYTIDGSAGNHIQLIDAKDYGSIKLTDGHKATGTPLKIDANAFVKWYDKALTGYEFQAASSATTVFTAAPGAMTTYIAAPNNAAYITLTKAASATTGSGNLTVSVKEDGVAGTVDTVEIPVVVT